LRLNPNASPNGAQGNVWRDGKELVMTPDATLPPRCVKCNERAEPPAKPRTVYWHHWGIYFLLLLNVIIYAIVAAIARRKAKVAPALCARHVKGRRIVITAAWLGAVLGFAMVVTGVEQGAVVVISGLLLLFGSILFGMILGRVVWAKHIGKEFVRLKGCAPDFLKPLPPFPY
jgi:hypothetical protein